MSKFLSPNAVRIVAFIAIFLSSAVAFCGNDTIPSAPQTAEEWLNKGITAYDNEDYEESIKCYNKAIELKPDYADAYYNMGATYSHMGNEEKTIEYLIKAAKLGHSSSQQWLRYNNISW